MTLEQNFTHSAYTNIWKIHQCSEVICQLGFCETFPFGAAHPHHYDM